LATYRYNNCYLGSQRLRFSGQASDIYRYFLVCWLFALPTVGLTLLAYRLRELRYVFARLELGDMRGELNVYFWPFMGLFITNYLLLIVTLGLAYPWVKLRLLRFIYAHMDLSGELDYARVRQEMERSDAIGEGFAEGVEAAFA